MITTTTSLDDFKAACWNTCLSAVAVKKRSKTFGELCDDPQGHGLLVHPTARIGEIRNNSELYALVRRYETVTVRGHGWEGETPFVWHGTPEDFIETWEGD